ncbi:MAG TPA: glycosyltransferase family 4 protein [Chthoniobacterales bacterium]|nr:glycosyltransferase family 4 protein [Chthoniobacterales bacterium]
MRITIVQGAFFPVPPIRGGAVEKVWFALGKEFATRGHEVTHISRAYRDLPEREVIAGVQHVRVSGFDQPASMLRLKLLDLIYSLRVRGVLPSADILVTNTFWLPLLVRDTRYGRLYLHVQRVPKGQMRWYGGAARLLAVSRAIEQAILAEAPALRAKVRVLPNCLPFDFPDALEYSRPNQMLFVGRIHPEKGLTLFLRALALLPESLLREWRLEIIGPHETAQGGGGTAFLAELQDVARELPLQVEWTGPVFEERALSEHYRRAAVFVYPSVAETGEALPLAPLEAMANGCVPLVSRLACFEDYIEPGVNGFVFDHRAPQPEETLAAALRTCLEMPGADRTRLARAAHERAREFAPGPVAERYLADFASLP